jgi:hypothetical protein
MLEQEIKAVYQRMADSDQPPSRVSLQAAGRRGRASLRWRRAGVAVTPLLAAGAVLAVVLPANLLDGAPGGSEQTTTGAAPEYFSALRPYAALGSLPGGASFNLEFLEPSEEVLESGGWWAFTAYAASTDCRMTRGVLACPRAEPPMMSRVRGPARRWVAEVHGHAAYWANTSAEAVRQGPHGLRTVPLHLASGSLVWQYARGGWALLSAPSLRDALLEADGVRFGPDVSAPVRFPSQLVGVPADWRVNQLTAQRWDGVLYASAYQITVGRVEAAPVGLAPDSGSSPTPEFVTLPLGAPGSKLGCGTGGRDARLVISTKSTVINGYKVWLSVNEVQPKYTLCADDADGLYVSVGVGDRAPLSPADLFGQHVRLLGTDPANWTTQPIG